MLGKLVLLLVGGGAGTLARHVLAGAVHQWWGERFPYGTLIVNLLGCFLIGYMIVITEEYHMLGPNLRLLLLVGFCGAFTTFSTFIMETAHLVRDGQSFLAFGNILLSVTAGFLFFKLGMALGEVI